MTNTEFNDTMDVLGIREDPDRAALLIGVHRRTIFKWSSGERGVPEPVARLLRYLVIKGITVDSFIETLS